mgnify:FL=1|tara:strand:- start:71 stop:316 length:246 start_codon:yes stop_codon:yes gene_type:complete
MIDYTEQINSSSINRLILGRIVPNNIEIMFKSSKMIYNYVIKDDIFTESLEKAIESKESLGKLVNKAIRSKELELIDKYLA